MYKFIITAVVKPGTLPGLMAAAKPCIAASRAEPGCISYDLYANVDRDDVFVAVECFKDKEVHAAHERTPHFSALRPLFDASVVSFTFETISIDETRIVPGERS